MKENNPTMVALEEARRLFPGRKIGCIVSLGCGLERHKRSGGGAQALAGVVTDAEETHRDISTKVMGATLPATGSNRASELGRQTHLGCGREGDGVYSDWLGDDPLYARINPELGFQWSNDAVRMDTKDAGDLANMEKAARAFVHDDTRVVKRMHKVRDKLFESEETGEPEPEPEPETEAAAAGVDWKDEVAKLVDELKITVEQAWAALDAAAGSGAAVTSLRAAREGTGWNVGAKR